MYAVVRTGGKQYRVAVGDILEVEKLEGDVGDTVALGDVLLVSNGSEASIGQPTVDGATVEATITGQHRGKKILVFRYRPKKRIRVRRGHRQYLTRLEIQSIQHNGQVYNARPAAPARTAVVDDVAANLEDDIIENNITEDTFIEDDSQIAIDEVEETIEAAAARVEETVTDAVDATQAEVADTVADVGAAVEDVGDDIADVVGDVEAAVEDAVDDVAAEGSEIVEAATDAAETVADADDNNAAGTSDNSAKG